MKIVRIFQLKIIVFTALKNLCILHRHVFVMRGINLLDMRIHGFKYLRCYCEHNVSGVDRRLNQRTNGPVNAHLIS